MSTVDFHSTTPHGPEDGTLDLTKLKLTLGQMLAFVLLLAGLIGTSAVSLYQLGEVRKAQDTAAQVQVDISNRIRSLEVDRATREGIEIGRRSVTTGGK